VRPVVPVRVPVNCDAPPVNWKSLPVEFHALPAGFDQSLINSDALSVNSNPDRVRRDASPVRGKLWLEQQISRRMHARQFDPCKCSHCQVLWECCHGERMVNLSPTLDHPDTT
jgi:hypothetical protein